MRAIVSRMETQREPLNTLQRKEDRLRKGWSFLFTGNGFLKLP